ncbi:MAG TPA: Ig-like domain-containing protein [Candidatus Sulfotelmatobacter sp.]|nr:Ig-like domain-containing protein [Candidatus Sulfotelmatobacter sp.]
MAINDSQDNPDTTPKESNPVSSVPPSSATVGEGKGSLNDKMPNFIFSKITATVFVAVFAVIGAYLILGGHAATPFAGTVTDYTDPAYLTNLTASDRSFYDQPQNAYLDTVPATDMLNAVGINFNVNANEASDTAHLLKDTGFTHARLGTNWGGFMSYANPTQVNPTAAGDLTTKIDALKANGIRPLIILYAGDTNPVPNSSFTGSYTVTPKVGDTTVTVSSSTAKQIVPGKTGIEDNGVMAGILFTAVSGNTVTLSKPIDSTADLSGKMTILTYAPFQKPFLADGVTPNPVYTTDSKGWLAYVNGVASTAKAALGNNNFDLEVWNELSFGSNFLAAANYYSSPPNPTLTGSTTAQILADTGNFIANPANGFTGVQITNGFASQSPFPSGSTLPSTITALSKHPYQNEKVYPADLKYDQSYPLNALMQRDYTTKTVGGKTVNVDTFTPSFVAHYPEQSLSAFTDQSLLRDMSPISTTLGGSLHGSNAANPQGHTAQVWITEYNYGLTPPRNGGDPNNGKYNYTNNDREYIQAKAQIRYLSDFVNKGAKQIDFYAAKDSKQGPYSLNLVDSSFISAVDSNPNVYPGDSQGGFITQTIHNFLKPFMAAQTITKPQSLALNEIDDYSGNIQFSGNGTAQYPDLYNRNVFSFYPYQLTNSSFLVPIYVQTSDLEKIYNSSAPGETKFDLPAETYRLTIGGVNGNNINSMTFYDPLTGATPSVNVISRSSTNIVIEVPVTDSPRLLYISETGNNNTQPLAPPTATINSPANNVTVSGTVNIQASATTDPRTSVADVQFYLNGAKLGKQISSAPYTYAWNTNSVANGSYTITAVVQDGTGAMATSPPVTIKVSNSGGNKSNATSPLSATILNPTIGEILTADTKLQVNATPSTGASITSVQYVVDGADYGSAVTSSPFEVQFKTSGAKGTHSVSAIVKDSSGQSVTTPAVSFTVN